MGMMSEVRAAINAEALEKILRAALEEGKTVTKFAKKHIIPFYENEVGEAWGAYDIPDDIKKGYGLR